MDQPATMPSHWKELSEKKFNYYFEVLPPIYGKSGPGIRTSFGVSEPLYHNRAGKPVYAVCIETTDGRYFETKGTAQEICSGSILTIPTVTYGDPVESRY